MKITEKTKIKELLPDGYKFTKISGHKKEGYLGNDKTMKVKLFFEKGKKDFGWYVMQYVGTVLLNNHKIGLIIDGISPIEYPFEFKIGLLKFICDDLDVSWCNTLSFLNHKYVNKLEDLNGTFFFKVIDICPEEFLKSIVL